MFWVKSVFPRSFIKRTVRGKGNPFITSRSSPFLSPDCLAAPQRSALALVHDPSARHPAPWIRLKAISYELQGRHGGTSANDGEADAEEADGAEELQDDGEDPGEDEEEESEESGIDDVGALSD